MADLHPDVRLTLDVLVAARRERLSKHVVVDIDERRATHHVERAEQS